MAVYNHQNIEEDEQQQQQEYDDEEDSRYYRKVIVFDFDGTITNTGVVFPVQIQDKYNPKLLDPYIAKPFQSDRAAVTRRELLRHKKEGHDAFVLATYNTQRVVLPVLQQIGLGDFFDAIVTADSYGARTAQEAYDRRVSLEYKNGMIRLAIGERTPNSHVMLVDDSESNVLAASVAGMETVHVGCGGVSTRDIQSVIDFIKTPNEEGEGEEEADMNVADATTEQAVEEMTSSQPPEYRHSQANAKTSNSTCIIT